MNPWVSINGEIVATLEPILPTAHDVYSGSAKTYAIFTTYNRIPEINASGKSHATGTYGDIDVFSDKDISGESSIIGTITTALEAAGIIVKDARDIPFDGVSHHVLIPFYKSVPR